MKKAITLILLCVITVSAFTGCVFKSLERKYINISVSELEKLDDGELFDALLYRTDAKVDKYDSVKEGMKTLSYAELVFYVVSYYEIELQNGGLCQYFVNSSRETAPELADCLEAIGATEQKDLFVKFVTDNNIDLNDLSSFEINSIYEYEAQTKRYPFDDYDDASYELEPVSVPLMKFVREHISEF